MFNLATMAFRGIRRRRTRNLMLAVAVVLGVMLTVGIDLSFKSVYGQLDEIMVEAAGSIDIVVRRSRPPFKVFELQPIRDIPGVLAVSPRVVQTMPIYTHGYDGDAYIVGVTPNDYEFQDPIYANIEGSRDLTGKKVCVVDERIGDPEIGRFLHIYTYNDTKHGTKRTDYTYTITGIISPRDISISTRDLYSVYLDIDDARFIFNKAERDLPYTYRDYHIDYAIVKVAIIQEGPRIAEEIRRILGPGFTAVPLKEPLLNRYKDTLTGLRDGLNLIQNLSLILIAAVTFNTGFIGTEERAHEIGVLRAVGASPFQVFWILFLETFTVSLLASFTGAIAGIAFGS
ncbi:MAG: ABC transporter permease, partial [Candidatus Bathyarchaeota archaeon]